MSARMTPEDRLRKARRRGHADETLPVWTPDQWLTVVTIKLGRAAESLYRHNGEPLDRELGLEHLAAVAAACLDAIEGLEPPGE